MAYGELQELVPACLNGLDGFLDYMGFWNIIDWMSIVGGGILMVIWILQCLAVAGDLQTAIADLPSFELDKFIMTNLTFYNSTGLEAATSRVAFEEKIAALHGVADGIAEHSENCRKFIFWYSMVLMMKFFKAFRANPRLNVVCQTLLEATVDFVHFLIVFMVIFVVFSLTSQVMFGAKIKEYSQILRSMYMCWRILMGDDMSEDMEAVDVAYTWLWVVLFQVVVILILFNMLLAIIMDTYSAVAGSQGDLTIWQQCRDAVQTVRETRGHLDLWYLICEFEDDDYPQHPNKLVTSKSLRRAFERDKMTRHNADYLVRKTNEYKKAQEEKCELTQTDAIKIVGQTKMLVQRIGATTDKAVSMLTDMVRAPMEARYDAIMQGEDPDNPMSQKQMEVSNMPANGRTGVNEIPAASKQPFGTTQQTGAFTPAGNPGAGMTNMGLTDDFMRSGLLGSHNALNDALRVAGGSNQMGDGHHNHNHTNSTAPSNHMGSTMHSTTSTTVVVESTEVHDNSTMASSGGGQGMMMMMQMMQRMHLTIEAMNRSQGDLRKDIERRNNWLEMKLNTLERRCEKAEKASDHLRASFQDFNFNEINDLPRRVVAAVKGANKVVNESKDKRTGGIDRNDPEFEGEVLKHLAGLRERDRAELMERAAGLPPDAVECCKICGNGTGGGAAFGNNRDLFSAMDKRIKEFDGKVEKLMEKTEEWTEMRKLFWKMDINVRKILSGEETANNPSQQAASSNAPRGNQMAPRPQQITNGGGGGANTPPGGASRHTSRSGGGR